MSDSNDLFLQIDDLSSDNAASADAINIHDTLYINEADREQALVPRSKTDCLTFSCKMSTLVGQIQENMASHDASGVDLDPYDLTQFKLKVLGAETIRTACKLTSARIAERNFTMTIPFADAIAVTGNGGEQSVRHWFDHKSYVSNAMVGVNVQDGHGMGDSGYLNDDVNFPLSFTLNVGVRSFLSNQELDDGDDEPAYAYTKNTAGADLVGDDLRDSYVKMVAKYSITPIYGHAGDESTAAIVVSWTDAAADKAGADVQTTTSNITLTSMDSTQGLEGENDRLIDTYSELNDHDRCHPGHLRHVGLGGYADD